MFIDNRPAEYDQVIRPVMLTEMLPAAASTTIVTLLGFIALLLI